MNIESAAKALRQLKAFEKQRSKALAKVIAGFNTRWDSKRAKVLRDLDDETREAVLANLGDSDFGDFGQDPDDTDRLLALRSAIDDHLGWRNEEEQEAGDYLARIRQVAEELGKPPPESTDRPAWLDEQPPESPPVVTVERKGKK